MWGSWSSFFFNLHFPGPAGDPHSKVHTLPFILTWVQAPGHHSRTPAGEGFTSVGVVQWYFSFSLSLSLPLCYFQLLSRSRGGEASRSSRIMKALILRNNPGGKTKNYSFFVLNGTFHIHWTVRFIGKRLHLSCCCPEGLTF